MEEVLRQKRKLVGLDFQRLHFTAYQAISIPVLIDDVLSDDVTLFKERSFFGEMADPSRHLLFLNEFWSRALS